MPLLSKDAAGAVVGSIWLCYYFIIRWRTSSTWRWITSSGMPADSLNSSGDSYVDSCLYNLVSSSSLAFKVTAVFCSSDYDYAWYMIGTTPLLSLSFYLSLLKDCDRDMNVLTMPWLSWFASSLGLPWKKLVLTASEFRSISPSLWLPTSLTYWDC